MIDRKDVSHNLKSYCKEYGFELKPDTTIAEIIEFLNQSFKIDNAERMRNRYAQEAKRLKNHRRIRLERTCAKCGRTFTVISGLKREKAKLCRTCSG